MAKEDFRHVGYCLTWENHRRGFSGFWSHFWDLLGGWAPRTDGYVVKITMVMVSKSP